MFTSQVSILSLVRTIGAANIEKMIAMGMLTYEAREEYKHLRALASKDSYTLWESNDGNNVRECVMYFNGASDYDVALELSEIVCTQATPQTWEQYEATIPVQARIATRKALRKIFEAKEAFQG